MALLSDVHEGLLCMPYHRVIDGWLFGSYRFHALHILVGGNAAQTLVEWAAEIRSLSSDNRYNLIHSSHQPIPGAQTVTLCFCVVPINALYVY